MKKISDCRRLETPISNGRKCVSGEAYENGEALRAKFYASDLIFIPSPLSYIPYYIIYYYGNFNMGEKRKEKNISTNQNIKISAIEKRMEFSGAASISFST